MTATATRRAVLGALAALALAPAAGRAQDALAEKGYAVGEMTMGDPDAPVTIVEYASLTCGHCANFHTRTWPEIKERYVETGQARLIFREVYFDQFGLWASMLSRCGGEEAFFPMLDMFLSRQQEWTRAEEPVAELTRLARLGGLSQERIQACLTDEAFMTRLVEDYQRNAGADEVNSTPTFLINGEKHTGDMSVEDFAALIETHL